MIKKLLILVTTLLAFNLYGQKVGVVLSGGGAKGLYHIGILKALEENEIPVDYISGTSMGSIVAGFYSAGYSPWEMEQIFLNPEVPNWVSGVMPDKYLYYYKMGTPVPSMFNFDVNVTKEYVRQDDGSLKSTRYKISTPNRPGSIISSAQLDMALMSYTAPLQNLPSVDFDSLFIPFRCVSVDINKNRQFVWDKGNVGIAIRSSMSIPIVFKPVLIDSMMMYDGGLMNNFPWQPLERDFKPDLYIGGKCTSGTSDPNTIVGQLEMLVMAQTDYNLPDGRGVMISRNVDVSMLDYKKVQYVIDLGYKDAMEYIEEIKEKCPRRVSRAELALRRLEYRKSLPTLVFDSIEIDGISDNQLDYMTSQFNAVGIDSKIDFTTLKREYYNMINEDVVVSEYPIAIYNDSTGAYSLDLDMTVKPGLKLLLGVDVSSTAINQGYVGLRYRAEEHLQRIFSVDGYFGTYHNGVKLGVRTNHYKNRPTYVEYALGYNYYDYARGNSQRFSYEHTTIDHMRYSGFYGSALFGMGLGSNGRAELRLATGFDKYSYFNETYSISKYVAPDISNIFFATPNISVSSSTHNYNIYPTRGTAASLSVFGAYTKETFKSGLSENPYEKHKEVLDHQVWVGVKAKLDRYLSLSKYLTLGYSGEAVYTNINPMSNDNVTKLMLPAFSPTPLMKTLYTPYFRSNSYIAAGIKPIIEFSDEIFLKNEVYGYLPSIDNISSDSNMLRMVISSTLVYRLPFGPISFNYSHIDDDFIRNDYFILNIGYTLFNKRGIEY